MEMRISCISFDNLGNCLVYIRRGRSIMVQKHKLNKMVNIPKINQGFKDLKEYIEFIGVKNG